MKLMEFQVFFLKKKSAHSKINTSNLIFKNFKYYADKQYNDTKINLLLISFRLTSKIKHKNLKLKFRAH